MSSGKGEAELKSEGDSAEDHAINRRVEVILKEK
jgi:flagellar motor protein MotB